MDLEDFTPPKENSNDPGDGPLKSSLPLQEPSTLHLKPGGYLVPGQIVGENFKIIELVGQGGFGCVYKAKHRLLNNTVALKTLIACNPTDAKLIRFRREAQAMAKLNHENLVRATDYGIINDVQPYLVMEWVEGKTLAQLLQQRGHLPLEEVLELFTPICFAMAYAHQSGIVHRDLKPSNIILARNDTNPEKFVPKVVDFGIAKIQLGDATEAQSLTQTGEVFGTPIYMSPEQCTGAVVDSRSDIYSLGCVMFEVLTGAPPFTGKTAIETMMRHGTATTPSLREASLGLKFPDALQSIISKMLEKDPNNRYRDLLQVAQDLIHLSRLEYKMVEARQISTQSQANKRRTELPALFTVIALAAVGCVAFLLFGRYQHEQSKPTAPIIATTTASESSGATMFSPTERPFYDQSHDPPRFNFPTEGGTLFWRTPDERWSYTPANGQVTVPREAQFILEPGPTLVTDQSEAARIIANPYVLTGVLMPRVDELFADPDALYIITRLKLKLLRMNHCALEPNLFNNIGEMQNLRWLSFLDCARTKTFSDDVAGLKNLANLDVLCFDHMKSPTAVLKKLSQGCKLRRLSLLRLSSLTKEDSRLLGRIESLTTLDLAHNDRGTLPQIDSDYLLEQIANLPHLERLRIDRGIITAAALKQFARMRSLKILVLEIHADSRKWGFMEFLKQQLPSTCEVRTVNDEFQDEPKMLPYMHPPVSRGNKTAVTDEWSDPQWFNPLNPQAFEDTRWH